MGSSKGSATDGKYGRTIFLDQFTWRSFLGSEIGLPCYRPGEIVFKSVAGWTQMGQVIGNGGTGRKEEFGPGGDRNSSRLWTSWQGRMGVPLLGSKIHNVLDKPSVNGDSGFRFRKRKKA